MMVRIACCLLLLCATACAPREQEHRVASVVQIARPGLSEDAFTADDGARLPLQRWLPEAPPKAVVLALHGFDDYSHAFASLGSYLATQGIATFAYDQRGFGAAPQPGIWGNQENMVEDATACMQALRERYPGVPFYLLGESMGGAVAIVVAAQSPAAMDGLILEAPAVWGDETMSRFYRSALWLGAHTMPGKRVTGSNLKILASDNIPMLRAMAADPLVIKKTRIDAIYGLVQLMDSAYLAVPGVQAPVLFLYGAHDQVIAREPIKHALHRFTVPVEFALYPRGFHMLIRDLSGQLVQTDIASWITDAQTPLPSGFGQLRPANGLPQ